MGLFFSKKVPRSAFLDSLHNRHRASSPLRYMQKRDREIHIKKDIYIYIYRGREIEIERGRQGLKDMNKKVETMLESKEELSKKKESQRKSVFAIFVPPFFLSLSSSHPPQLPYYPALTSALSCLRCFEA